ncbi:hypothetical protein Tco_1215076 [Tanacetum coccineum]
MSESAKRHGENSKLIKEIRASTDDAIRNQGVSIKNLEIQIGQMSKVLHERGFGSLLGDTVYLEELLSVINSDPNLPPSPVCEINVHDKIKSSCEDPPDLELKDLPSHLEIFPKSVWLNDPPPEKKLCYLLDGIASKHFENLSDEVNPGSNLVAPDWDLPFEICVMHSGFCCWSTVPASRKISQRDEMPHNSILVGEIFDVLLWISQIVKTRVLACFTLHPKSFTSSAFNLGIQYRKSSRTAGSIGTNKDQSAGSLEECERENVEGDTINTATTGVSASSASVTTAGVSISTAEPRTPPATTTTSFEDEDLTIAQTLVKMRRQKDKEKGKGVAFRAVQEQSARPTRILPTIAPKDKCKGIMQEPEKPLKNPIKVQIQRDAKIAQRLFEEEQAWFEREQRIARERAAEQEANDAALIEQMEDIQARMDADELLEERL